MAGEIKTTWPNGAVIEWPTPDSVIWTYKDGNETVFESNEALATLLAAGVLFYNRKIYVNCNDVFAWGCADAEDVNNDLETVYRMWLAEPKWGAAVWCLIQRKELPQRPVAKAMTDAGHDLKALAEEHGLRPNHYDGVSGVLARMKYKAYCEWERARGKTPRPYDAQWWTGWREFSEANPEWSEETRDEADRLRTEWRKQNGFDE